MCEHYLWHSPESRELLLLPPKLKAIGPNSGPLLFLAELLLF